MNRAFLSLYAFIVASVILLGWGLNSLWDSISPDAKTRAEIYTLFDLLEKNLTSGNQQDLEKWLQNQTADLQIIPLDELAATGAFPNLRPAKY